MKKLLRLFRRKPKGYRFPNGIPRAEVWGAHSDRPWVIFEDGDDK